MAPLSIAATALLVLLAVASSPAGVAASTAAADEPPLPLLDVVPSVDPNIAAQRAATDDPLDLQASAREDWAGERILFSERGAVGAVSARAFYSLCVPDDLLLLRHSHLRNAHTPK